MIFVLIEYQQRKRGLFARLPGIKGIQPFLEILSSGKIGGQVIQMTIKKSIMLLPAFKNHKKGRLFLLKS